MSSTTGTEIWGMTYHRSLSGGPNPPSYYPLTLARGSGGASLEAGIGRELEGLNTGTRRAIGRLMLQEPK